MFHPSTAGMIATYAGRRFGPPCRFSTWEGPSPLGGKRTALHRPARQRLGSGGDPPGRRDSGARRDGPAVQDQFAPAALGGRPRGRDFSARSGRRSETRKPGSVDRVVMVLRTFVAQSFRTLVPIPLPPGLATLISIGLLTSPFTVAGAVSALPGHLSDRIGYKPIFYVTFSPGYPGPFSDASCPRGISVYLGPALAGSPRCSPGHCPGGWLWRRSRRR